MTDLVLLAQGNGNLGSEVFRLFNNSGFIFWGCVAICVVVPTLLHYWAKVRTTEARARLVHDLVAQGMDPEQIKTVLSAAKLDKDT